MSDNNEKRKPSLLTRFLWDIIWKVILSPLVVFVGAYFLFDRDFRKGVLFALIYYSVFTIIIMFTKFLGIFGSAMTFQIFQFLKKSIDIIIMSISLVIYWLTYSIYFSADFSF